MEEGCSHTIAMNHWAQKGMAVPFCLGATSRKGEGYCLELLVFPVIAGFS